MKKIACWIWLSCRFRNGRTVNRLLEEFGSPEAVYLERFLSTGEIDYCEIDRRVKFYENPFQNRLK